MKTKSLKSIFKEANPGSPTKKTSVDEDRWFIDIRCHTKSNHCFRMMSHLQKELGQNDKEIARMVKSMQRHARSEVERHNKEIAEQAKQARHRKTA